jgi:small subunit ribosomal protein S20
LFVANHASAEKRNRQRIQRTLRNRGLKSEFRTLVKRVRAAVQQGDLTAATTALTPAITALDTAVSKGRAAPQTRPRVRCPRLASAVHKLQADKQA